MTLIINTFLFVRKEDYTKWLETLFLNRHTSYFTPSIFLSFCLIYTHFFIKSQTLPFLIFFIQNRHTTIYIIHIQTYNTTHATTFLPYIPHTIHGHPFFPSSPYSSLATLFIHTLKTRFRNFFVFSFLPRSHEWKELRPPAEAQVSKGQCSVSHNNHFRALQTRVKYEFCDVVGRWQHQKKMCKTTVVQCTWRKSPVNTKRPVVSSTR